jgi:hypothetical protein
MPLSLRGRKPVAISINSKNRLLRRFTPRNDTAVMSYFFANGIILKRYLEGTSLRNSVNLLMLQYAWPFNRF